MYDRFSEEKGKRKNVYFPADVIQILKRMKNASAYITRLIREDDQKQLRLFKGVNEK